MSPHFATQGNSALPNLEAFHPQTCQDSFGNKSTHYGTQRTSSFEQLNSVESPLSRNFSHNVKDQISTNFLSQKLGQICKSGPFSSTRNIPVRETNRSSLNRGYFNDKRNKTQNESSLEMSQQFTSIDQCQQKSISKNLIRNLLGKSKRNLNNPRSSSSDYRLF
jgi:hypothetical protein